MISLKLVLPLLILVSCNNSRQTKGCHAILRKLVAESDLKKDIPPDFVLSIDDSTATTYILKISNLHEERGDEVAIKWLSLDFEKKTAIRHNRRSG